MTPEQYCRNKALPRGSSLYYSLLFLPPEKRDAVTPLYAFHREVSDVVDECAEAAVARTKLAWWRHEIASMYQGTPQHPVCRALQPITQRLQLPEQELQTIIDGVDMDLGLNRYPDFKTLALVCHRIAGAVGKLSAEIFGYRENRTLRHAQDLGLAIRLTSIVRNVGRDARRNRIYLPSDEMARFAVQPADIIHGRYSEGFRQLMEFQIARTQEHYTQALAELTAADRANQRSGLVMAAICRTLLDEIRADGCRVLDRRMSLTPLRKLWIAWRTWNGW